MSLPVLELCNPVYIPPKDFSPIGNKTDSVQMRLLKTKLYPPRGFSNIKEFEEYTFFFTQASQKDLDYLETQLKDACNDFYYSIVWNSNISKRLYCCDSNGLTLPIP